MAQESGLAEGIAVAEKGRIMELLHLSTKLHLQHSLQLRVRLWRAMTH